VIVDTLEYTGTLVVTGCWCGITVGVPSDLYRKAQNDSSFAIHCPLGHTFVYSKGEADRQRERAERAEADARRARASATAARDQAAAAHRSAIAYKGHATRLRNRIAAGVCPVAGCRRSFANVRAHIAGQHPDWAHEHPEAMTS
jgi:hypothetical protein